MLYLNIAYIDSQEPGRKLPRNLLKYYPGLSYFWNSLQIHLYKAWLKFPLVSPGSRKYQVYISTGG